MPGSWDPAHLPGLTNTNHAITSPVKNRYNCIAWAAGDDRRWWWPTFQSYWPPNTPRDVTLDAFVRAFETLGYSECPHPFLEPQFEKVAIYVQMNALGTLEPTHAARQLPNGKWTSKLGKAEDITHDNLGDVDGPAYGYAAKFMKRPI